MPEKHISDGIQEACLTQSSDTENENDAHAKGKSYIGGPTDPEQGKAAAGVGALFLKGLAAYEVINPTEDYRDAERSGRCKTVCFDSGGVTITCAIVYDWTGAKKGNALAARTDDILAIIELHFEAMDPVPKLVMGDLNSSLEAFPTAMSLITEPEWTDMATTKTSATGGQVQLHVIRKKIAESTSYWQTAG